MNFDTNSKVDTNLSTWSPRGGRSFVDDDTLALGRPQFDGRNQAHQEGRKDQSKTPHPSNLAATVRDKETTTDTMNQHLRSSGREIQDTWEDQDTKKEGPRRQQGGMQDTKKQPRRLEGRVQEAITQDASVGHSKSPGRTKPRRQDCAIRTAKET